MLMQWADTEHSTATVSALLLSVLIGIHVASISESIHIVAQSQNTKGGIFELQLSHMQLDEKQALTTQSKAILN